MGRYRKTQMWIVTYSNGSSGRIVAKNEKQALTRAMVWANGKGLTVNTINEVV